MCTSFQFSLEFSFEMQWLVRFSFIHSGRNGIIIVYFWIDNNTELSRWTPNLIHDSVDMRTWIIHNRDYISNTIFYSYWKWGEQIFISPIFLAFFFSHTQLLSHILPLLVFFLFFFRNLTPSHSFCFTFLIFILISFDVRLLNMDSTNFHESFKGTYEPCKFQSYGIWLLKVENLSASCGDFQIIENS